jgi:hypothetical protein
MRNNILVLAFALTQASAVLSVSKSFAADLNQEATLNLNAELALPDVRKQSSDYFEFGYATRELRTLQLTTPAQTTRYDFSDQPMVFAGYHRNISQQYRTYWAAKLYYFNTEAKDLGQDQSFLFAARLHVLPIEAEVYWRATHQKISPIIGAGIVGLAQVQRGVDGIKTSEFDTLYTVRTGIDWKVSRELAIKASYIWQDEFGAKATAWSGQGIDAGLVFAL